MSFDTCIVALICFYVFPMHFYAFPMYSMCFRCMLCVFDRFLCAFRWILCLICVPGQGPGPGPQLWTADFKKTRSGKNNMLCIWKRQCSRRCQRFPRFPWSQVRMSVVPSARVHIYIYIHALHTELLFPHPGAGDIFLMLYFSKPIWKKTYPRHRLRRRPRALPRHGEGVFFKLVWKNTSTPFFKNPWTYAKPYFQNGPNN